jgi:hypothetical protein
MLNWDAQMGTISLIRKSTNHYPVMPRLKKFQSRIRAAYNAEQNIGPDFHLTTSKIFYGPQPK